MTTSQRWTMLATILGTSMVFLDGTIVNLALPRIGRELPASLVVDARGPDLRRRRLPRDPRRAAPPGRRPRRLLRPAAVFAIGLVGFGITSVLCGLAPTLELLIVARLLQGAAGALLVPGSLAIITATFAGEADPARAFGIWAAAAAATGLIGPILGGVLVDTVTWRAAFLINVPLVILALFATCATSRRAGRATRRHGSTGSARRSRSSRSAAWRSGRSAARSATGRTRWPGRRSRSAPSRSSRSRS